MSDKNEYWKELFGDDFPDDLAEEIGLPTEEEKKEKYKVPEPKVNDDIRHFNVDDDSQWMSLDQDLFDDRSGDEPSGGLSDTNTIPDGESISSYTKGDPELEINDAEPIYDEDDIVPEDADYITDEEIDGEEDGAIEHGGRKRNGCLGGLMYFAFIVGIGIILASVLWLAACDVLALNKDELETQVTVSETDTVNDVAKTLKEEGLIEYTGLFNLFAKVFNAEEKIDPGTYTLNTTFDYRALIRNMSSSSSAKFSDKITITPGKTMKEIFTLLDEKNVCSYDELMEAAANTDFGYEFIGEMGSAERLEGYLFPDTYEFYMDADASTVIKDFLKNFDKRMQDDNVYDLVAGSGYTLDQIVNIASIIEKEAASNEEMPTVASVIYNRLNSAQNLEIDATIQYILPERKENLTIEDTQIDNPYNTYLNEGLPPTPISNPQIASILAALKPDETDYLYYALSVDEEHEFFVTPEEHQAFIESEEFAFYDAG